MWSVCPYFEIRLDPEDSGDGYCEFAPVDRNGDEKVIVRCHGDIESCEFYEKEYLIEMIEKNG